MNDLQIFNYNSNEVRTIQRDGEPWFVLKDVCQVLGISKYRDTAERLDPDERGSVRVDTPGGQQEMTCINESGLYNVIIRSDKPEAKPFRKWVTSEVLPSIRKHGMYATAETVEKMLSDPDAMIQVFTALKEERAARQALAEKVEQDKPKVLFADAVATAHTSILVGELAKMLKQNGVDIGQNRLFRWMREQGYLIRRNGADFNMPTQKAMEMGLFEIKETVISHADGHTSVNKTPKVTGKGQQYFVRRFLS
ncbi:MAG: phage antirepressor [Faecousia sp.]